MHSRPARKGKGKTKGGKKSPVGAHSKTRGKKSPAAVASGQGKGGTGAQVLDGDMGAWPRNSVADASFELYCELDRTGTSTKPRQSASGTASSARVPASLPPPQNATGTADGEAMAVYKAKVSNIMREMMARMRRDAQERDEIADTANEWRRKHDELLGRHEAAGRRLVRVMDALGDAQQREEAATQSTAEVREEAQKREAAIAAECEVLRQKVQEQSALLKDQQKQLLLGDAALEQQQLPHETTATTAVTAAAAIAEDIEDATNLRRKIHAAEERARAAEAALVKAEADTSQTATELNTALMAIDRLTVSEAAASASVASAEARCEELEEELRAAVHRHEAMRTAMETTIAGLQSKLEQTQAQLIAARAAKSLSARAAREAYGGATAEHNSDANSSCPTPTQRASKAGGQHDEQFQSFVDALAREDEPQPRTSTPEPTPAPDPISAKVSNAVLPIPRQLEQDAMYFHFHMTVQTALAEAMADPTLVDNTALGCNTPLIDSAALFREATGETAAGSDLAMEGARVSMHEWPSWIARRVREILAEQSMQESERQDAPESQEQVQEQEQVQLQQQEEDGEQVQDKEQEQQQEQEQEQEQELKQNDTVLFADVSGFVCPICFKTFSNCDDLLQHHGEHEQSSASATSAPHCIDVSEGGYEDTSPCSDGAQVSEKSDRSQTYVSIAELGDAHSCNNNGAISASPEANGDTQLDVQQDQEDEAEQQQNDRNGSASTPRRIFAAAADAVSGAFGSVGFSQVGTPLAHF